MYLDDIVSDYLGLCNKTLYGTMERHLRYMTMEGHRIEELCIINMDEGNTVRRVVTTRKLAETIPGLVFSK